VKRKEKPAQTTAKKRFSPTDKLLINAKPAFALGFAFQRST
jgi:hypothetical protein